MLTAANSLLPIWRPSSNEVCVYGKQGLGKREGEMDVWRDKISSSADCLCLLTVLFSTAGQFGRVGQLALYGCARPEVPHDGLYLTLYRLSLSLSLKFIFIRTYIYEEAKQVQLELVAFTPLIFSEKGDESQNF